MSFDLLRRRLLAGCALGVMLTYGVAGAATPAGMKEVVALAGLPAQIRADLGVGRDNAISDRGGPFNASCIMVAGKPNQRFVLAAVGPDTAVVAVEHGGIAHGVNSLEYRLANGDWTLVRKGHVGLLVVAKDELLAEHARTARAVPAKKD